MSFMLPSLTLQCFVFFSEFQLMVPVLNLMTRPSLSLSDFSQPVSFENAEIGRCPYLGPPPPPLPLPTDKEEPEEEKEASKPLSPPPTPAPATPPPGSPAVSGPD